MTRLRSPSPSEAAPKSGAVGRHQRGHRGPWRRRVRVRVMAAEIGQRHAIDDRALAPRRVRRSKIGVRIRPGDGVHRIEAQAEASRRTGRACLEVEQRLHQPDVVGDRVDDLDRGHLDRGDADRVDVEIGRVRDLVGIDDLGAGEDRVGDLFRGRAASADIVLDPEIAVRPARIVAGGEDDAAERA